MPGQCIIQASMSLAFISAGKFCQRFSFLMSDIFHDFLSFHLCFLLCAVREKNRIHALFVSPCSLFSAVVCIQSPFYFVKDFKIMNIVLKEGFLGHTENRSSCMASKTLGPYVKERKYHANTNLPNTFESKMCMRT